jgi:enamine deaminase RidA (YjgF/YER057c/UK114 family)
MDRADAHACFPVSCLELNTFGGCAASWRVALFATTVLREAGFTLSDVMRLNYYTTDVDQFFGVYDVLTSRLAEAGCRPASMLVGVARLAYPEMLIEIEATAVA